MSNALHVASVFNEGRTFDGVMATMGALTNAFHLSGTRGTFIPCAAPQAAIAWQGLQRVGVAGQGIDVARNLAEGNYLQAAVDGVLLGQSMWHMLRACFSGDTQLLTASGYKRIDQFQVGDRLLSRDENDVTGRVEEKEVEEVFVRTGRIWRLHVQGQLIRTTGEHPFYVYNKGWVAAEQLQAGDLLSSHDGQWVAVEEVYDTGEYETVYNIAVSDYHTYFVGEESWHWSVWAHNLCEQDFESDANYQALKDRYRGGLDALGRTPEEARRQQYTEKFIAQLTREIGRPMHLGGGQKLIDLHGDRWAFYREASKYDYTEAGLPGRSVETLYRRVGEMLYAREKYATQAQAHHLVPWNSKQHPHHRHPLLRQAGLGSREALRDHVDNIRDVIGHGNLPGEKGGHWDPYHDGVTAHLDQGWKTLNRNKSQQAALAEANRVFQRIADAIASGELELYAPPHAVSLL